MVDLSFENSLEYAKCLDAEDPLAPYRNRFHYPKVKGKEVIYFTGNSLGLQPKNAGEYVDEVMQDWASLAVEGHFLCRQTLVGLSRTFSGTLGQSCGGQNE